MEGKVSLAETLKDWLSRREIHSFSCSVFRKMAGVPLKDCFSSTDDIKGCAHTHSRYQKNLNLPFLIWTPRKTREGHRDVFHQQFLPHLWGASAQISATSGITTDPVFPDAACAVTAKWNSTRKPEGPEWSLRAGALVLGFSLPDAPSKPQTD